MKLVFSLFAALMLTTATFAQTAADPMQDPTALGNAFFKAMLDEDGTISKYLTNDFSIISFDGQVVDGDLLAQAVGGGYVIIETGVISDARTRQYNADAAVMTANWKVKGSVQGQALDNTSAVSAVMVKQNGAWKISSVQFTPMK